MPMFPVYGRADQLSTSGPHGQPELNVDVNTHATTTSPWTAGKTGTRNLGWRDKIKAGTDASSYYKRTSITCTVLPLLGESVGFGSIPFDTKGSFSNPLWNNHALMTPTDSVVRDQALARIKRRIASLEESFQLLVPLAEMREARELHRQLRTSTTSLLEAVADLKRTKGKSLFRFVQDRWLIYSFGVRPTIADLNGLAKSVWAYLTKGDVRDRVQGTMGKDWFTQRVGDSMTGMLNWPIRSVSVADHRLSYRYVAGWKFLLRSSNDYSALDHLGLNLPSLVPAAWETTMYSWIVDYFTTTGAWLDDTYSGSAGQSMYVVENRKYQYRSVMELEYYPAFLGLQSNLTRHRRGSVVFDYFEFERTPLGALPARVLRFKTVDEIGKHALTKLLNLAALTLRGGKPAKVPLNPHYHIIR